MTCVYRLHICVFVCWMPICAKYDVPGTDRGARWYKDLERLVRESMFEIVGEVYASEAQCKLRY